MDNPSFDPRSLEAQAQGAADAAGALARQLEQAEARVAAKRIEIDAAREKRLAGLSKAERLQIQKIESRGHDRSLADFRAEVAKETAEARSKVTEQLRAYAERAAKAEQLFATPGHLLGYKGGLGSERRASLATSIENMAHAELVALKLRAELEGDLELGAALHSRVSRMDRKDRPFDPNELANALVGEEHEQLSKTIKKLRTDAERGIKSNTIFEQGRELTPTEKIEVGLAAPRPSAREELTFFLAGRK